MSIPQNVQNPCDCTGTEKSLRSAKFILPDTCFLMDMSRPGSRDFEERLEELLRKNQKHLWIPKIVLREAQHHIAQDDPHDAKLARKAQEAAYAVQLMEKLYCKGLVKFYRSPYDKRADVNDLHHIADLTLQESALTLRTEGNVLVLTNDDILSRKLLDLNSLSQPVHSRHTVIVKALSPCGWLQQPKCFSDTHWYENRSSADRYKKGEHHGC